MITIFTIPKSFESAVAVAQLNAIQSWMYLQPACEIILCGDDPGVARVAAQFDLHHMPDTAANEFGTPLLSDAFARVEQLARFDLLCYVNTDILLMSDFTSAVQRIPLAPFLMIGRRWNVDDVPAIDFDLPAWEGELRDTVDLNGDLQPPEGSDYFVYERHTLGTLPEFAVGRPGWDNWMIYNARKRGMPVIDATHATVAVHQNHDYGHVKQRYDETTYDGPEADCNLEIMGGNRTRFTVLDSTHILTRERLAPARTRAHLQRRVVTLAALHPRLRPLAQMVRTAWPSGK